MAIPRPTTPADVPRILDLIRDVFAEYGCVLDAENEDTYLLNPGPYFREHGGEFWVVEEAGQIIATVAIILHQDAGELKCLYVHRDHRRQGWGRRLSELVLDFARQAGKHRVRHTLRNQHYGNSQPRCQVTFQVTSFIHMKPPESRDNSF